ncbi:hypothetical protein NL676_008280 [Syzygium grande]|nr:hypothetical protein NL676_008280 [Syzygium grande]
MPNSEGASKRAREKMGLAYGATKADEKERLTGFQRGLRSQDSILAAKKGNHFPHQKSSEPEIGNPSRAVSSRSRKGEAKAEEEEGSARDTISAGGQALPAARHDPAGSGAPAGPSRGPVPSGPAGTLDGPVRTRLGRSRPPGQAALRQ